MSTTSLTNNCFIVKFNMHMMHIVTIVATVPLPYVIKCNYFSEIEILPRTVGTKVPLVMYVPAI